MGRKQMIKKFEQKRSHALVRAGERYHRDLTVSKLRELERLIRNGEGAIVHWCNDYRYVVRITALGCEFIVVWDRGKDEIVTFLPMDAADRGYLSPGEYKASINHG